jgi:transposase InsO family protein
MSDAPKYREQLAWFRYAVIAPLLAAEPEKTLRERIEEQAARLWTLPDGRTRSIGFGTIEKWLYAYRAGGIDALRVQRRSDAGSFRGIDEEVAGHIDRVLHQHPGLRTHAVIEHLAAGDLLGDPPPSQSTLYRYIKARRPAAPAPEPPERRSFEAPYAGYLWQADIMYGPHLPVRLANGRRRRQQTYLIAVLDDHSRLLCHGEFFARQDMAAWLCCLQTAVRKRGIPFKLYCDNGRVFTSHQLRQIAAGLGIELLHTRVRDAAAKGKIERFFQKVRRSFLAPLTELSPPASLQALNRAFFQWVENGHNHREHSAFGDTPIRRFMESSMHLRTLPADDRSLFHVRCERTVKKDGTFSLEGRRFETAAGLVGRRITVSYDLQEPLRVAVHCGGVCHGTAGLLDPGANNRRPRNREGTDRSNSKEGDRTDA